MADAAESVATQDSPKGLTIETSRFGQITVDQDKVITMISPFLGFPESRRFVLRPHGPESPFLWLQSLDDPKLAFVVISPALAVPDYRPSLPRFVKKELGEANGQELELLIILTIPQGEPKKMTANLLGPVAINAEKRLAKQVLLDPTKYNPCWPLFPQG